MGTDWFEVGTEFEQSSHMCRQRNDIFRTRHVGDVVHVCVPF